MPIQTNFMKKILVISGLTMITNLNAQEKFGLGVKIGQNFSKVDNVVVDHIAASYHIGAVATIAINSMFSIAPEVILSQTKLETTPTTIQLLTSPTLKPETFHLTYLTFPVLFQFKPVKSIALQAGPQYGILLDQTKDGTELASTAFKSGEFSFIGGAKLNLGGFFVYGRYVIGLENIKDTKQLSSSLQDQSTWKSRQWQLGIGLTIF